MTNQSQPCAPARPSSPSVTRRQAVALAGAAAAGAAVAAAAGAVRDADAFDGMPTEPLGEGDSLLPNSEGLFISLPQAGEVAYVADPIPDKDIAETVECDVVVCGAGISGAAAAASAAQNGLKTVLLEKGGVFAARASEVGALGDKAHAAAGIELDPAQFVNDGMATSHFRADRHVWQTFAQRSGEALDWAIDLGQGACGEPVAQMANVVYDGVTTWGTGVTFDNGNANAVYPFIEMLLDKAVEMGCDLRYETPACQLVQDADGRVAGVVAKAESGYVKLSASKGVVLATGGYEFNPQMMKERIRPRDMAVFAWCNPTRTNTGDGHLMGIAAGAAEDDWPHILMNDPAGAPSGNRAFGIMPAFLRVNSRGERFVNESLSFEYLTNAIMYQPGACDYVIMSGDILAALEQLKGGSPWTPEEMYESIQGDVRTFDTLEDLAAYLTADPETLRSTIERYNELCAKGEDEDFGKSASALFPLESAPYYAVQESGTCLTTVNGLKTDWKSEVLNLEGKPIAGLYALGNASGSMFFGTYPHHLSAVSTGRCLTFGYLLGRRLAGVEE